MKTTEDRLTAIERQVKSLAIRAALDARGSAEASAKALAALWLILPPSGKGVA